ncbi:iron-containing alcohol dehydrogenase [Neobittarella massiliensis]|uniref:iron-containing alcohol dehydrogenase n=1 Tax=Neobittarella massiliensis (ex Bilen et al. 2018) TaxID=2041842 RepID=UPI000CF6FD7E|nr:iron-containing alcohol dehydrogenase [Neobittarella massiliensis]
MQNFTYSIPTTILFGRGQIQNLGAQMRALGSRVLLCYGGGSIKKSGLYQQVLEQLQQAGISVTELAGIEPNPRIESVKRGVELCRAGDIQAVLAVGGGSVIDCAKVVAAGVSYPGDTWDIVLDAAKIVHVLPVASVLTLAATGSEMDCGAVITNLQTHEKLGTHHPDMRPKFSVLDPTYTYTVSKWQTACGTADIMSHILESYFTGVQGAFVQARFCEGLLRSCIHYGPIALAQPDDYEARANLMWTSSLAINNLLSYGAEVAWSVHAMEHELSAFYDITHGAGLAILTPTWMEHVLRSGRADALAVYGTEVWGIDRDLPQADIARMAIDNTRRFFKEDLGLPGTLGEVGIDGSKLEEMAHKAAPLLATGTFVPLRYEDILAIYRASL